uniref:Aquaporin n=1 Tax=Leersia perrieri TaxID=77586 RepID=A0A0D9UY12_9ORYZ
MAGREDGAVEAEAMEEGRERKEVNCENSEDGSNNNSSSSSTRCHGNDVISVQFMQKILAEILGTYFMIFAGCGAVVVNLSTGGTVTFPGICAVWGLVVMVLVYSVGHISGAHFNPAVTIAFATCGRFPWKQVPSYVVAQVLGSTMASLTLRVVFAGGERDQHFFGTAPAGSNAQAVALEFVISFFLMFVVSGVATDNRAFIVNFIYFETNGGLIVPCVRTQIGELAGLAVGATVAVNVLFAGPVTGASMNPARSLGPAMVAGRYGGVWVYVVGPVVGTVGGAWAYNLVRFTDGPLREITKTASFLKSARIRS